MEVKDLIDILIEQNKSFIEQNKNYKDMLVWAVGSIITLLVIFLTANFLTMSKMRKSEIDKIKAEILDDIKSNSLPDLKTEVNESLKSLVEAKFSKLELKITNLEGKLKDSKREILKLEGHHSLLEGNYYFERGIYANAFSCYIKAANAFLDGEHPGHINGILRSLEKTAEKLPYVLSHIGDFNKFASRLSSEYQPQVNKITEILKEKKPL